MHALFTEPNFVTWICLASNNLLGSDAVEEMKESESRWIALDATADTKMVLDVKSLPAHIVNSPSGPTTFADLLAVRHCQIPACQFHIVRTINYMQNSEFCPDETHCPFENSDPNSWPKSRDYIRFAVTRRRWRHAEKRA